jgi:beta-lactam-binding protein with PASTA domain
VVGLSQGAATDKLRAKGFEVEVDRVDVSRRWQDGSVVAQSPHGGAKVKEGATVVISVGRFEPGGGDGGGDGGGGDGD